MKNEIDFLEEINNKYSELENELDQKLKKLLLEEQKLEIAEAKQEKKNEGPKKCSTLEEARQRNSELIKSLEVAKARLRSRATYSPIEGILQKAVRAYEKETSLIPYSRKTNDTD